MDVVDGRVDGLGARERDLPGVDGEPDAALSLVGRVHRAAGVEHDLGQAVGPGRALPGSRFAPVKLATNASAGAASSSAAGPSWRIRPSTITPTRSASAAASSKSCVTSSVGSRSSAEQLGQLGADDVARVRVERGERLVEQEHGRVAGECPRKRDPLPLTPREVGRPRLREV